MLLIQKFCYTYLESSFWCVDSLRIALKLTVDLISTKYFAQKVEDLQEYPIQRLTVLDDVYLDYSL